ncbi:hypothetical protein HY733_01850 [Candidatus Uhrbacteria bacterium]|nr:hypothetical protein [Candidatus Uhrbacteria bacterium]
MASNYAFVVSLVSLTFIGAGCAATDVSSLNPEEAAASLLFAVGNEIVVQPTILGVGGSVVDWFGGEEEERTITLNAWTAGESVNFSWSIATQVETQSSIEARTAYDLQYATSPVGVEISIKPEAQYEEKIVTGSIASESMMDADTLMLPEAWPEGEGGISTSSLIWLSRTHYDELVNTRTTKVSLGLFDESLMQVEEATSKLQSIVDGVAGLIEPLIGSELTSETEDTETDSLLALEADPQWGEYTLLVDGVKTSVRVVEAYNAFASYKILANPDNPLILEIQLTPLSQGNLELLSKDGISEGFGGYEVTQISSSSADQPQP